MFILYGLRGKVIPGNMLNGHTCDKCGDGSLRMHTVVQYAHIFWIPLFPYEKQLVTECTHCQHVAKGKEIPTVVKSAARSQNLVAPIPKYLFTGGVLVALLAGGLYLNSRVQQGHTRELISAPASGDCYVVDYTEVIGPDFIGENEEDLRYGVMRLHSLDEDSVFFEVGTWAYEYASDAGKAVEEGTIHDEGYFLEGGIVVSRADLLGMWNADQVKRVIRE